MAEKPSRYEIKKHIVESGGSKVFNAWHELVPSLTKEEFVENLKWLCEDPCAEYGNEGIIASRSIGLTPEGIIHLQKKYPKVGPASYFTEDGKRWEGSTFDVSCDEREKEFLGKETRKTVQKIQIEPYDKV